MTGGCRYMKARWMRRSSNEFCATLAKAGVASGLPPDLAEEVALAAALLTARGGDGVAAALRSLSSLRGLRGGMATACTPQHGAECITYAPTCAAAVTIAAAEALCATWHDAQPCSVHFKEVDSPLLLAALVAVAAGAQHLRYALTFHPQPDGAADAVLRFPEVACALPATLAAGACRRAVLQVGGGGNSHFTLPPQGMVVHPAAWEEVETLAAQTRVPASTHSREAGAGAGTIDND